MKTRTIRQRLADKLRGLKPQQPNVQKMVAAGWLITISEDKAKEHCLKELQDVKAHIKNQFEQQVGWLVGERHYTPAEAEKEAFEHALFRIKSWETSY
jgi:hypothetical protein